MKHLRRLKNLIFCRSWSFYISSIEHSRAVARQGDTVYINGIVCNDGIRLGSAYIVVKIADPYNYSRIAFDSHRDLEFKRRQALRVIDLNVGDVFRFSVPWIIDTNILEGVYYYRAELWNIPRLFRKEPRLSRFWNYCFDRTPWTPAVEIISPKSEELTDNKRKRPKAFISYSWDSADHQNWVMQLADHLLRNGIDIVVDKRDLAPGEEITEFIERGISESDILLLVCSENYTEKANSRLGGVGMETVISSAQFLQARRSKKFIPIVRNNRRSSKDRLPTYLGSILYVDMDVEDWEGEPLQQLLAGIRKEIT